MRILHVWDVAGVASLIAKYQRRLGHDVDLLMGVKKYDPFGLTTFNGFRVHEVKKLEFVKIVAENIMANTYDVIHVHSLWKLLPMVKVLGAGKPLVVFHAHGTDVRIYKRLKSFCLKFCDRIFVSTEDLLYVRLLAGRDPIYIPTPVDVEHFKRRRLESNRKFTFYMSYLDYPKKHLPLDVEIINRDKAPVSYSSIPDFIARYGLYYDIKFQNGKPLEAMSKTGLECLSIGLMVCNWRYQLVEGLPQEHLPENVATACLDNYGKMEVIPSVLG